MRIERIKKKPVAQGRPVQPGVAVQPENTAYMAEAAKVLDKYTMDRLAKHVRNLANYQENRATCDRLIKDARGVITHILGNAEVETAAGDEGDIKWKATIIEPTSTTLESDLLKNAIGARAWNKLTNRVLDPALVEQAVRIGELPASIVKACTYTDTKTKYLKVSIKKPTDDSSEE